MAGMVAGMVVAVAWGTLIPPEALGAEKMLSNDWPWWVWPILLFLITSIIGVLAVMGGIGGSVLFVPVVSGFLPFLHIDFARGAGLMVALTGALTAGPQLLKQNLAQLKLAIPVALIASFASIFGARIGLALPPHVIQISLGLLILGMSAVMFFSPANDMPPQGGKEDPIAHALGISGVFKNPETGEVVIWKPRNMLIGLVLFSGVGIIAGMFGIGAGWANVPILNVLMGVPLKLSVATSYFLLAITDTSAAWVYLSRGALLPLIVIPSVMGIMIGARLGTRLLIITKPAVIRRMVIVLLLAAGLRALLRGFGI